MAVARNKKHVRLEDIAETLKLSLSTVSRALAGNAAINEETRQAVQQAAVDMGYRAKQPGRRKPRVSTRTVGVMIGVNEMHNPFMTRLLDHIRRYMLEYGYHVLVLVDPMNSHEDTPHLSTFRPLIEDYLEGMILCSTTVESFVVSQLQRLGVPLVMALRSVDNLLVDTIEPDNIRGGAELARHLYELGHRHIGLIMGPEEASTGRNRAKGALDFLRDANVPASQTPVMWNAFTFEAGYSCATQVLDSGRKITAIIAGSDSIAMGVLEAARCKSIEVPRFLSVTGFDDLPLSGTRLIGLTTVHNPVQDLARIACRRMVDRIRNGGLTPPTRDLLPVQLVRRETTAPPPHL